MRISTLLSSATLFLSATIASASPFATHGTLVARSGCGSIGPLGEGHFIWYITVTCNPGDSLFCQATDNTGCLIGNPSKIGSMEVDDPNNGEHYASGTNTASVLFTCPAAGQVNCQANFNDNDDGPNYSLRVAAP